MINKNNGWFGRTITFTFLLACLVGCGDGSSEDPQPEVMASFIVDNEFITEGASVSFTDQSSGDPTMWEWQFEGGTPGTSTDRNPTIQYNEPGIYDVILKVSNATSDDTKTMTGFITVTCACSIECSENCTPSLLTDVSMQSDGLTRTYDVYLPSSHDISSGLPVILDLHGFTSDTDEQRAISTFTDLAEENDFIVVWPEALASGTNCVLDGATGKYWNSDWGIAIDDITFIDELIDQLDEDYNVDLDRVYVTGLSNGGFMTYSIACALSERIAAVASVAGSMTVDLLNSTCQPTRQMPVMHVHGTADAVVFLDGEESCKDGIAAIDDVVSFWRMNAGCNETYTEVAFEDIDTSDGSTARMWTYDDCGNRVQFLVIDNGGHNWPGSVYQMDQGISLLGSINNDINTNELIWEFFKQNSLP